MGAVESMSIWCVGEGGLAFGLSSNSSGIRWLPLIIPRARIMVITGVSQLRACPMRPETVHKKDITSLKHAASSHHVIMAELILSGS